MKILRSNSLMPRDVERKSGYMLEGLSIWEYYGEYEP